MRPATLAILFLERDDPALYVISALAEYWRQDGISVKYLFGTRHYQPADLLILHLNLSVVPDSYLEFAARYPRQVNLRVRDIRKRSFSQLTVEPDSSYAGPVIVKSDLNYGGLPESRLHPRLLTRWNCWWQSRRLLRLEAESENSSGSPYPVYASLREVPAVCWENRHWLVEKFISEKIGDRYAIRSYHFLGDREVFFLLTSRHPFVKSETIEEVLPLERDPRLSALRRQMGFDYGKFDYVLLDGEPMLFDINKTVGLTAKFARDPATEAARRERAKGIYNFLEK